MTPPLPEWPPSVSGARLDQIPEKSHFLSAFGQKSNLPKAKRAAGAKKMRVFWLLSRVNRSKCWPNLAENLSVTPPLFSRSELLDLVIPLTYLVIPMLIFSRLRRVLIQHPLSRWQNILIFGAPAAQYHWISLNMLVVSLFEVKMRRRRAEK